MATAFFHSGVIDARNMRRMIQEDSKHKQEGRRFDPLRMGGGFNPRKLKSNIVTEFAIIFPLVRRKGRDKNNNSDNPLSPSDGGTVDPPAQSPIFSPTIIDYDSSSPAAAPDAASSSAQATFTMEKGRPEGAYGITFFRVSLFFFRASFFCFPHLLPMFCYPTDIFSPPPPLLSLFLFSCGSS